MGPRFRLTGQSTIAFSVLLLASCGPQADDRAAPPPGAPVSLSPAPVLVVGERADDADHELYRVVTPFLLPDGGIGVPLASEGTIRIFDRDGDLVRTLGSPGEGPGEFMGLAAAWARGDTIEAFDDRLQRITRFVPGEAPQTVPLDGIPSAQSGLPGLADGSFILYGVKQVQPSGRDLIAVHRFAPDGTHLGELYETEGFRRHRHAGGSGPDPISPRAVVRANGTRVYVAETLTPRIEELDASGERTHSIEWTPRGALSSADAVAMARADLSGAGEAAMDEAWTLASFDALDGGEDISVFWDFLVDGDAFFWVRDYDPRVHATHLGGLGTPGPGGSWSVLDRGGREVTTLTVPTDFEPSSIDSDYLIGVRRNALDVESVRVYRIERGGS